MIKTKLTIFLFFVVFSSSLHGVTLVYNLRIRRIFNIPLVIERLKKKSRWPITAVPIFSTRESHITDKRTLLDTREKRGTGGILFNARYILSPNWWAEITTGIETDHASFKGSDTFSASRTGFDDIVISGGYRYFLGDKIQLVGYGLIGLPTQYKIDLHDRFGPLLGTRIYTLGGGTEASYSFISTLNRSFAAIAQTRFLHGFNRKWNPILPEGSKIQPGNSTDILLTLQYREKRLIIEGGYDATLFTNQALILPTQKIETDAVVRHSAYLTLSYVWLKAFFNKPFVFGTGFNVNRSKTFDAKTVTSWLYGTIVF
jgi:hypothetical protein